MEIKNFTITKRDGSKDQFSLDKIMNAIVKAFDSVDCPADLGTISKILSHPRWPSRSSSIARRTPRIATRWRR